MFVVSVWDINYRDIEASPGLPSGKESPAVQETKEMQVQSLGGEDPLEEESGRPLQYSCLENPMDRGAWWATVHGVTESDMTE